jgi:hypothetical protein
LPSQKGYKKSFAIAAELIQVCTKVKANSNAASNMPRRYTKSAIKPTKASMKIDAEGLAANVHGLPHIPAEGTKAADEVMNSDILGPGSMMVRLLYPR